MARPVKNPSSPYWLQGETWEKHRNFRSSAELPRKARVVVIGAGMTGMSCAFHLTENGIRDICVLDARGVSEGASGRNAGHLWASTGYVEAPTEADVSKFGVGEVHKMQNFEIENIKLLANFIKKYNVEEADLMDTGGLHFAINDQQMKELTDYYERINALGLNGDHNVVLWGPRLAKAASLCSKAVGGLYYRRVGQARPAHVIFKLCDLVHERGGNVQTHTEVKKVTRAGKNKYTVHTERGDIECDYVVYCCNAYTSALLPELKDVIIPTRGQMIVTSPLDKFELPMNLWINSGYEYLNQRPDRRLCAGGMRWRAEGKESGVFDDSTVNNTVSNALKDMLTDYFPALRNEKYTIDYEWTGIMAFTPDFNPLVGRWRDNEFIGAGFGGYGMPRTFHSGKYLADTISGKMRPEQVMKFYEPHRFDDPKSLLNRSKL